jgi:hypothetical protein
MSDMEARISQLESELSTLKKRNRALLPLALMVACVPFLIAGSGQQVVKADKFEVTKGGKVVAALTSDDDGGALDIFNKDGELVANVMTSVEGQGQISIYNSLDGEAVRIVASKAGSGSINVYNEDEQLIGWLVGTTDGNGTFRVFDSKGEDSIFMSAGSSGGVLNAYNSSGTHVLSLGANTAMHGSATFYNSTNKSIVFIGGNDSGGGQVDVNNNSGTEVGWIAADAAGNGQVSISHKDGKEVGNLGCVTDGGQIVLKTPGGSTRWFAPN